MENNYSYIYQLTRKDLKLYKYKTVKLLRYCQNTAAALKLSNGHLMWFEYY